MNIWLTTDWHLGHEKIAEKGWRPADYEDRVLENIFTAVHRGDWLVCLGDAALYAAGKEKEAALIKSMQALGVTAILVRGNHDAKGVESAMARGWHMVCETFTLEMFGKIWMFSHEPVSPRAAIATEWPINVHGHLHNDSHRGSEILDGHHILLSLERMDYRPITLRRLSELLESPVWSEGRFVAMSREPWDLCPKCAHVPYTSGACDCPCHPADSIPGLAKRGAVV